MKSRMDCLGIPQSCAGGEESTGRLRQTAGALIVFATQARQSPRNLRRLLLWSGRAERKLANQKLALVAVEWLQ